MKGMRKIEGKLGNSANMQEEKHADHTLARKIHDAKDLLQDHEVIQTF
jgi:hypothetical protein